MPAEKFSIIPQPRDFELLRSLFDSRIMTLSQISRLFFDGRDESAKKRVQKLKAARFLSERKRQPTEPSILFLARNGFQALSEDGHLSAYPKLSWNALEKRTQVSDLTLRHELEIQEFKAALTLSVRQTDNFSIGRFWTWPLLYEFRVTLPTSGSTYGSPKILLKPDGFIQIVETDASDQKFFRFFFLEVDRSTESLSKLVTKALAYRKYYRSGGLAVRFGSTAEEFAKFPFRVLFVLKSEMRRDNVAESLLKLRPPILKQCWLTTLPEATADPLGEIWRKPEDKGNIRNRLL